MSAEHERVLVRIARGSGPYKSAVLSALDIPAARSLVVSGFATSGPFDDWFNITDQGLEWARAVVAATSRNQEPTP